MMESRSVLFQYSISVSVITKLNDPKSIPGKAAYLSFKKHNTSTPRPYKRYFSFDLLYFTNIMFAETLLSYSRINY
jgi:hypothetical protein